MDRIRMLLTILFVIIFSTYLKAQVKIYHPTDENLYRTSSINNSIDFEGLIEKTEINTSVIGELSKVEELAYFTLGTEYGEEHQVFGRIDDVVTDRRGRIFILDGQQQKIRVFDKAGKYIQSIGRKGNGPGEFEIAKSMAVYNDSLLYVNNGYRIEEFDVFSDSIKYIRTISFEERFGSICILGKKLFVHKDITIDQSQSKNSDRGFKTILSYKVPVFEEIDSFGTSYISDNPMVVDRLSSGKITCSEPSETVILTYSRVPIIQGFSANDGTFIWQSEFSNLKHYQVVETTVGGMPRISYTNPSGNVVENLTVPIDMDEGYNLLQVISFISGDDPYDIEQKVDSYILNTSDGKVHSFPKKVEMQKIIEISDDQIFSLNDDHTILIVFRMNN